MIRKEIKTVFNFPQKSVITLYKVKANSEFSLSVIKSDLGTKVVLEGIGKFIYRELAGAGNIVGVVGLPDRVYDEPLINFRDVLSTNINFRNEPHYVIFNGTEHRLFATTVCLFRAVRFSASEKL